MFSAVTATFIPMYFRSRERKFDGWNFRSMELSSPGTFAPESENNVKLSLWEWKMACNFHSTPCPKIVVATNCTHGEQGSQDIIPCSRPVEVCRPSEAILSRSQSSCNTCGIPLIRPTGIIEYSEFSFDPVRYVALASVLFDILLSVQWLCSQKCLLSSSEEVVTVDAMGQ